MAMRIEGPVPEWMLEKFPELREYSGKKPSKYRSRRVIVDGITFDSVKEANRYQELLLEKRAGLVLEIELQPRFVLQEGYRDPRTLKWVRPIAYKADFRVVYADHRVVVIDVKPSSKFQTKEYRIKKKMLLAKYPDVDFREEY